MGKFAVLSGLLLLSCAFAFAQNDLTQMNEKEGCQMIKCVIRATCSNDNEMKDSQMNCYAIALGKGKMYDKIYQDIQTNEILKSQFYQENDIIKNIKEFCDKDEDTKNKLGSIIINTAGKLFQEKNATNSDRPYCKDVMLFVDSLRKMTKKFVEDGRCDKCDDIEEVSVATPAPLSGL